jgi:hypothetical protein
MSVISFFNDLGIIPNKGTGLEKDENLLQGQQFMEYGRYYNQNKSPLLIEGLGEKPPGSTYATIPSGYMETTGPQPSCFNNLSPDDAKKQCDMLGDKCVGFSYSKDGTGSGCYKGNHNAGINSNPAYMGYIKVVTPSTLSPAPVSATATSVNTTGTASPIPLTTPTLTTPPTPITATVPNAPTSAPTSDINSPEEMRKRDPYGLNSVYSIKQFFGGISNGMNNSNIFDDTFGLVDKDNNNKITKKEFDVFVENKMNQMLNDDKLTPDQKNEMKIMFEEYKKKLFPKIFDFEDKNKDGVVSWEEYTGPKMNVKQIFNSMDENKDGKLTLNEMNNWKKTNMNDVNFDTNGLFNNLLDTNKDGVLTTDEIYNNSNKELYMIFGKDPEYKARQDALSKSATAPMPNAPAPPASASAPPVAADSKSSDAASYQPVNTNDIKPNMATYSGGGSKELDLDATTKRQPINQTTKTILARRDDSVLETRTFKYHYIAWILVLIFIIWAILNVSMFSFSGIDMGSFGSESASSQSSSSSSSVFSMIIIIILIIISLLVISKMNSSSIQTNVKIYGK